MGAVQLVGPEGSNNQHPGQPQVADEEAQQVTGGPVRPMHVFDDENQWRALCEPVEQCQKLLKEPRPSRARVGIGSRLAKVRQQPRQVSRSLAGQQRGHVCGAALAGQLAQGGGEWRVWQSRQTHLEAATSEDENALRSCRLAYPVGEFTDEPRLASAGLAAQDNGRWYRACRLLEGPCQH